MAESLDDFRYDERMFDLHLSYFWLLEGLAVAHALTVIAFSIRILLRDELSSAARLAWFMVMLFAP